MNLTRHGTAILTMAPLCIGLILAQFYRSMGAVIAPELAVDLGLGPEALGILVAAFLIGFSLCQVPIGIALDRWGTRVSVPPLLGLAAIGAGIFASATDLFGLVLGQLCMGAGSAGNFIGAAMIGMRWFPSDRFATVNAAVIGTGGLGYLLSASPLTALVATLGWRGTFWVAAAATLSVAVLVALITRDAPPGHSFYQRRPESLGDMAAGFAIILRTRSLWLIAPIGMFGYGALMSLRGLWIGPYLDDVHGLGAAARGDILLAISAIYLVSAFGYGPLDRILNSRKRVILGGGLGVLALFCMLAIWPQIPLAAAVLILCLYSLLCCYYQVSIAHTRDFFPDHLVGRGVTTANLFIVGGSGFVQFATGFVIDALPLTPAGRPSEVAFRWLFAYLALLLAVSFAFYAGVPDIPPRRSIPGEQR
jgi:MFS family permease